MTDKVPIEELAGELAKRGDAIPVIGPDLKRTDILTHGKCACQKLKSLSEFKVANSGVVTYTDNVCEGCEQAIRGLAVVICTKCKEVIARVEPFKDATGFVFSAGRAYHTAACPNCSPGLTFSPIIEKVLHDRRIGRTG